MITTFDSITIRLAHAGDGLALARLAALDSAEMPRAPVLVAEVNGELRAALSQADGSTIADPFHPTSGLIDLLRARARSTAPRRRGLRRAGLRFGYA